MEQIPDYVTTDQLVAEIERLREENARLVAEVDKLKQPVKTTAPAKQK